MSLGDLYKSGYFSLRARPTANKIFDLSQTKTFQSKPTLFLTFEAHKEYYRLGCDTV
jgi:hypothetical protein